MPTRPLPDSVLIEALNLVEEFGSPRFAEIAGATKINVDTLRRRIDSARLRGLKPTFRKDAPRIYTRTRIGKMHLVIPDTQCRPGVRLDHLGWIGNYIVEKKPDVIIHIGDHWDMPSLSSYDKGKLSYEGKRYVNDIKAGKDGMDRLFKPIHAYNRTAKEKYAPQLEFMTGNHEQRIVRMVDETPGLEGKCDVSDMGIADYGWTVNPFLKVKKIDGIEYSHYFTSGVMGRPVSSAAALLRERQCSATMGHVQNTDIAVHKKTQNIALFAGICYLHSEDYLGPQGNATRRQIIVKHEVEDGTYDPMLVSLRFLEKAYA